MKKEHQNIKDSKLEESLLPRTRVHPISLGQKLGHEVFLKREDEVGFAMTGGKLRKYASLIPWLKSQNFKEIGLIGGSNSNHLVSASQLLLAEGFKPKPIVKANYSKGSNFQLLDLLVPQSDWKIIASEDWNSVDQIANDWKMESPTTRTFLPEGAFMEPALHGAMTLADDIWRNCDEHQIAFQNICIDAGTCLSAIALAFGLHQQGFSGNLHVVLMAESKAGFFERWNQAKIWLTGDQALTVDNFLEQIRLYPSITAPKFGNVNVTIRNAIPRFAREFGILTDPIYLAKLFLTCESILDQLLQGENMLLIHGGGAQSLLGFLNK